MLIASLLETERGQRSGTSTMLYHIETEERSLGGHSGTVYTLSNPAAQTAIEVWPGRGFNCLKWQVHGHDLLFSMPDWETNPVPTRSGVPILFPFPNRIRDGVYLHQSRPVRLPKNDSTGANAIHGFAPRSPWHVFGYSCDSNSAWIHGDFRIADAAPAATDLWPGDALFSVTYRLTDNRLRIEMRVRNMSPDPFPFGIGLHPYFRLPVADADVSRYVLHAPARNLWQLEQSLPTGELLVVPDELNWNRPKRIGSTQLDHVYANLGAIEERDGLLLRGTLSHDDAPGRLEFWTTADFRESVLFTPAHRKAVCFEPYTCTTDAINLQARGIDAGWRELPGDSEWTGAVEFAWRAG
jgi:aldose 1-epimerase